jgi:hypothetical protein
VDTAESRKVNWLSNLAAADEEVEAAETAEAAAPAVVLEPPTYPRTPTRIRAANLLQQLAAMPFPEAAPAPREAELTTLQKIGLDRILYGILAVILLVGILFPSMTRVLQPGGMVPVSVAPGAAYIPNGSAGLDELFQSVESLSEGDIVLLAYEWDTQRRGELAPLEQAVTQHLIERRAHMVLMSTDPQGTMLSFDLRDRMRQNGYQGKGIDYVLLGYRPGGELALRAIAQNFRAVLSSDFAGSDASKGALATNLKTGEPRLRDINDVAMIVVIANQSLDVQNWIEQVHRVTPTVPMALLLPSEVAPIVQPYLDQPGILHLTGKQGALAYSTRLKGISGYQAVAEAESGQHPFTVLIFVVLIIIGIVASNVGPFKRSQSAAEQTRGET